MLRVKDTQNHISVLHMLAVKVICFKRFLNLFILLTRSIFLRNGKSFKHFAFENLNNWE